MAYIFYCHEILNYMDIIGNLWDENRDLYSLEIIKLENDLYKIILKEKDV